MGIRFAASLTGEHFKDSEKRMQSTRLLPLTFHFQIVALQFDEEQQLATHLADVGSAHGWHLLLALMMHTQIAVCKSEGSDYTNCYSSSFPQLTLALDTLMRNAVQQHAAFIAESGRGVGGRDPAVLDLGTVGIEVRILAGALEDNELAAFLMYIEAAFYREREREGGGNKTCATSRNC